MQPLDGAYEIEDHAHGPEELAIHHDQMATIRDLLGKLSEDQRAVIELRLSGMSADEIALILVKSRNAIDQAQFRAVARLRALFAASETPVAETRRS